MKQEISRYKKYKDNYQKYRLENKEKIKKYRQTVFDRYGISLSTIGIYGLKLALEVYDKFDRKCSQCGAENDLTIHHMDGKGAHNREKGLEVNNDIDNLKILCRRCHGSIHGKESGALKTNIAERRLEVLEYLKGKDFISPTEIGALWGGRSSIASPVCMSLVELGLVERNPMGHYKLKV